MDLSIEREAGHSEVVSPIKNNPDAQNRPEHLRARSAKKKPSVEINSDAQMWSINIIHELT